jgi:hypothetical protein
MRHVPGLKGLRAWMASWVFCQHVVQVSGVDMLRPAYPVAGPLPISGRCCQYAENLAIRLGNLSGGHQLCASGGFV